MWKSQQKSVTARSVRLRANQSRPTTFVSVTVCGRVLDRARPLFFATVLAFLKSDWGFWADRFKIPGQETGG